MSLFYFSGNQAMSSNNVLCTDCFYLKRDDKNVICTHPSSSQLSVKWNLSRKLYETTSESKRNSGERIRPTTHTRVPGPYMNTEHHSERSGVHHCRDNGSGESPLSTMQLLSKIHTHLKGTAGNESDPQHTHGY